MLPSWKPVHIHTCKEKTLTKQYGSVSYCSRCNIWLKPEEKETHYNAHLENLGLFCGLRRRKKTVIVAGLNPWDLGNGIYKQFTNASEFQSDLRYDLKNYYSTHRKAACPHPRCQDDEDQHCKNDLVLHFHDVHGIEDIGEQHIIASYETHVWSLEEMDAASQTSTDAQKNLVVNDASCKDESHSPALSEILTDGEAIDDMKNINSDTSMLDYCNQNTGNDYASHFETKTPSIDPLLISNDKYIVENGCQIILYDHFGMDGSLLKPLGIYPEDGAFMSQSDSALCSRIMNFDGSLANFQGLNAINGTLPVNFNMDITEESDSEQALSHGSLLLNEPGWTTPLNLSPEPEGSKATCIALESVGLDIGYSWIGG
jgi:hypothetical protein